MSASVDANGPRWFVANVMSELVRFLVTRGFWTRALLSNPTSGRPRENLRGGRRTLARSDMSHTTGTACPPMRSMAFLTSLSVCGQGRSSLAGAHPSGRSTRCRRSARIVSMNPRPKFQEP